MKVSWPLALLPSIGTGRGALRRLTCGHLFQGGGPCQWTRIDQECVAGAVQWVCLLLFTSCLDLPCRLLPLSFWIACLGWNWLHVRQQQRSHSCSSRSLQPHSRYWHELNRLPVDRLEGEYLLLMLVWFLLWLYSFPFSLVTAFTSLEPFFT